MPFQRLQPFRVISPPLSDRVAHLRTLVRPLLDPATGTGELKSTVDALFEWFCELTGLRSDAAESRATDTALADGVAISPRLAAQCMTDPLRTAMFMRGFRDALRTAGQRFGVRPLQVVYAGTGPFATIVLPQLAFLDPAEVRITFIDVHRRSTDALHQLVGLFGFKEFVRDVVNGDATKYVHPAELPMHILVSETMQTALASEPFVPIVRSLAPQLAPRGLLIPERVVVDLALFDVAAETQRMFGEPLPDNARVLVQTAMDMSVSIASVAADGNACLPAVDFEIPATRGERNYSLAFLTRVLVFGELELRDYECSLTYPRVIRETAPPAGSRLSVRYCLAPPGFVISQSQ
jgi:hypothetical protein